MGENQYYKSDNAPEFDMGAYPPAAFFFKVQFRVKSGVLDDDTSFMDVSGIGREMETEDVVEGGENRHIYRLPKQVKYQKLILKRGVASKNSMLITWCKAVLEGGFANQIVTRQIQVSLLNAEGKAIRSWDFDNAYPVKWSVDGFSSTKNDVAIETIELNYSGFTRAE
jgi:phage tail-like protein